MPDYVICMPFLPPNLALAFYFPDHRRMVVKSGNNNSLTSSCISAFEVIDLMIILKQLNNHASKRSQVG